MRRDLFKASDIEVFVLTVFQALVSFIRQAVKHQNPQFGPLALACKRADQFSECIKESCRGSHLQAVVKMLCQINEETPYTPRELSRQLEMGLENKNLVHFLVKISFTEKSKRC
jgi:hypothetical protein